MAVNLRNVLTGIAARSTHHRQESLIKRITGEWINDMSEIEVVGDKRFLWLG
jgi:hypothetical protein